MSDKNVWPEIERAHFLAGSIVAFLKGMNGDRRFGAENKTTLQSLASDLLESIKTMEAEEKAYDRAETVAELSKRIEKLESMKLSNILQTGMRLTDRECRERNARIDAKILSLSSMLDEYQGRDQMTAAFI